MDAQWRGKVTLLIAALDDTWTRNLKFLFSREGANTLPENNFVEIGEVNLLPMSQGQKHEA